MTAPQRGGDPIVWFDFGGVLSPPIEDLFTRYEEVTGIRVAALQRAMASVATARGLPTLAPVELALIDEHTWVRELHAALSAEDPGIDLSRSELDFGRQWFTGHEVNGGMRDFALELAAAGVRVGVLSNNVVEWEPYWRSMIDLDHVLTDLVDSSRVGVRKPDRAIFELAAERTASDPGRSVLIDDLPENCAAASEVGWHTVRFTSTEQAIGDVRDILAGLGVLAGARQ
ncbi:HAD-IA family hydrolase [Gordonia sinesedis]